MRNWGRITALLTILALSQVFSVENKPAGGEDRCVFSTSGQEIDDGFNGQDGLNQSAMEDPGQLRASEMKILKRRGMTTASLSDIFSGSRFMADANEPNGYFKNATAISYGDSVLSQTIDPAGDVDIFMFSGTAGDWVNVTIYANRNGSSLNPYIHLYDPDTTTVLGFNDDYYSYDSHLLCKLHSTGDFYIYVRDYRHPTVGGSGYYYTITLKNSPDLGVISGYVYESDGTTPIENERVRLYNNGWGFLYEVNTDSHGQYFFDGLGSGDYFARANGYINGQGYVYFQEYYNESPDQSGADLVSVTAPDITAGINFTLDRGGSISGTVYESDGTTPIANAQVSVSGGTNRTVYTNASGQYYAGGLVSANYYVLANGYIGTGYIYVQEYYDESPDFAGADQVGVTAPNDVTGIDFTLDLGGSISGTVYESDGVTPIEGAIVNVGSSLAGTNSTGQYTIGGIAAGYHAVQATGQTPIGYSYIREYYDESPDLSGADLVTVAVPDTTTGIDFTLDAKLVHDAGNVVLQFSNDSELANFGSYPSAFWPKTGGNNYLYDGGLWIGGKVGGEKRVMRYRYHNYDWTGVEGKEYSLKTGVSDQDGSATYDDRNAATSEPIGLEVHQSSYQWSGTTRDDFIMFRYVVKNRGVNGTLDSLFVALWNDPDVGESGDNYGGYESSRRLLYVFNGDNNPTGYYGIKLLGPDAPHTVYSYPNPTDPTTNDEHYDAISSGSMTTPDWGADWRLLMTATPFSLASGDSAVVMFGIVLGDGIDELRANADTMQAIYEKEFADYVCFKTRIYLEGPYQAGGIMTTALKTAESIPLVSPYADARTVASIPDAMTDWISVELRAAAEGPSLTQRSFFLKSDGRLYDVDGVARNLPMLHTAAGNYYVVIRHRNHIPVMSASALPLEVSGLTGYAFQTGTDKFYGADAKLLETGVYGMYAGDTNATGTVDANDRSAAWNNRNKTGYESSDCNLSGTVDANDRSTAWNNRNKTTSVP